MQTKEYRAILAVIEELCTGLSNKEKIELFENIRDYSNGAIDYLVGYNSIEELDLSVRAWNCLRREGIETLYELTDLKESQLIKVRNLGKKTLKEIKTKLAERGLSLKGEED